MRVLRSIRPTPEQLTILGDISPGCMLIRGAAGSGKTTTALYRLQQLCASRLSRRVRLGTDEPVRALVLTYNRTLEAYIKQLAKDLTDRHEGLELEVSTFSKWALGLLDNVSPMKPGVAKAFLGSLVAKLPADADFLCDEVAYVLDRFDTDDLDEYLTARRDGRGATPRMERSLRESLLNDVIKPYIGEKARWGVVDWNDVALAARAVTDTPGWDVVIVDEAQDFTANQVRAIMGHLNEQYSLTFVMDAMQRIYPRFFTWREAGVEITQTHTLARNYRNTKQIARFALPLLEGLALHGDGALPNFEACGEEGRLPTVVSGLFSSQMDYIINRINTTVNLSKESVGILHPKGWFSYVRQRLTEANIAWVEITGKNVWPEGDEQVALSTLHSAKGLEFDHVYIPGLNGQVTSHGQEEGDTGLEQLRRLLAVGIGRARASVIVGYLADDPSTLVSFFKEDTFEQVTL